jgi:hypothetical protein
MREDAEDAGKMRDEDAGRCGKMRDRKMRDRRCGTDEITPKWMSRRPARSPTKRNLTIPCGEHSSIRLMIGLQNGCTGENA